MAQIPLTFVSTAPGELRFALVNETQLRSAIGHGTDVDLLVDQAVAAGSVGVGEDLYLLSGHLAALGPPASGRSPQITLWWTVTWTDGSRAWQYDAVTRAAFASRWGGTPGDFEAIRAGGVTIFRPARAPINATWGEGIPVLRDRLDAVAGDGSERIAWIRDRLEAQRTEALRVEAARIEAKRVADEHKAVRQQELLAPISDEFARFLERVRGLTDGEIEALGHEVFWSYTGSGLGFGGSFDRITRGRQVVPRDPRALYQVGVAWGSSHGDSPASRSREVKRYVSDLACLYAIPEDVRGSDPNRGAMEGLMDPWRRVVLHSISVRDVRWWHIALLMFIGVCVAVPAAAVGTGIVVAIVVLFGLSAGTLLYFLRGN
jgi:hypothetical protein